MNDIQKLIAGLPEKHKSIFSATLTLEASGRVSAQFRCSPIAENIFRTLFDDETYEKAKKCLYDAMMEISGFIAACPQTAAIINVTELQKQAGEKSS